MAWLRLDDGFASHPKIAALSDREYRVWTRLLLYCARYRTEGKVPENALVEIPQLTRQMLQKFRELRLLDPGDIVHDWRIYNAETVAEKVAAFFADHPEAASMTANEIYRAVGGKRELVLAEIHKHRSPAGSAPVPGVVPGAVPDQFPIGTRARAPVPSPEKDVDDEAPYRAEESSTSTPFSKTRHRASPETPPEPPAPNGAAPAQPVLANPDDDPDREKLSQAELDALEPDPEGLARIAAIEREANERADAERDDDARLDTDDAIKRQEASRRRLERLHGAGDA